MEATTDLRPSVAALPTSIRSMGAMLGAILGLMAMGSLYLATSVSAVESVLQVRFLLGPDGIAASGGVRLLAWVIAPVAAAIAGWISAPRALVGRRFAGVRMGFWTYAIAIAIAPLLVIGPDLVGPYGMASADRDPSEFVQSLVFIVPMSAAFAAVILAPLLLVCAGAGVLWGAALRWVTRGSGDLGPHPDIPETDTRLLLVMTLILGVFWLLYAVVALGLSPLLGGDLVD